MSTLSSRWITLPNQLCIIAAASPLDRSSCLPLRLLHRRPIGAGGCENRSCIGAIGDRETELVFFDERLRKRR
jgi:hypothetical protein